jgi:hypothetical protein
MPINRLALIEESLKLPCNSESFRYEGDWHLPSSSNETIYGVLSYDSQGLIELKLKGMFGNDYRRNLLGRENEFLPLIFGIAKLNPWRPEAISLFDAKFSGGGMVMGTLDSKYRCNTLIIGNHIPHGVINTECFSSVLVGYTNLEYWLGDNQFEVSQNKEVGDIECSLIKYTGSQTLILDVPSIDAQINLEDAFDYTGGTRITEAGFRRRSFIRIRPSSSKSLGWFLNVIYQIAEFFSLAMMTTITPDRILISSQGSMLRTLGLRNLMALYIDSPSHDASKPPMPGDSLILFDDVRVSLTSIIDRWFVLQSELRPCMDLFFRELYERKPLHSVQFLALVQALEAYHRRRFRGLYVDDNDFEAVQRSLRDSLPSRLDDDFRRSLKGRFRYLNEYTLRRRLSEIIDSLSCYLEEFIDNQFSDIVTDIRNSITHNSSEVDSRANIDGEIPFYNSRLFAVLAALSLKKLSIDSNLISKACIVLAKKINRK